MHFEGKLRADTQAWGTSSDRRGGESFRGFHSEVHFMGHSYGFIMIHHFFVLTCSDNEGALLYDNA